MSELSPPSNILFHCLFIFISDFFLFSCFILSSLLRSFFWVAAHRSVLKRLLRFHREDKDDDFPMSEMCSSSMIGFEEGKSEEFPVQETESNMAEDSVEEERLGNFLKAVDDFQGMCSTVEENKAKPKTVVHGSDNHDCYTGLGRSNGSVRKKGREWKRTLACKLFEERHNVKGGEGMDMLWEAYEFDSSRWKKEAEFEDEHEDGGDTNGQLCCLHALKLSAGKMNLGLGKGSLARISKVVKGLGWLHRVTKRSKNVHCITVDKDVLSRKL